MKKLLLFVLLISSCFAANAFNMDAAGADFITIGKYSFGVPEGPAILEDGQMCISWSVAGSVTSPLSFEFTIESKNGTIAVFKSNNASQITSNWSSQDCILLRDVGQFSLKVVVREGGKQMLSTTLRTIEIKRRPINLDYTIQGSDEISDGRTYQFDIFPTDYIKSTKWSVSNTSLVEISNQLPGSVMLNPRNTGNLVLSAQITLTNGEVKTISKNIYVYVSPLKDVKLNGEDDIVYYGQDIKYNLTGVPSGASITWSTNYTNQIKTGQGTTGVSLNLHSYSQFTLSAVVQYGGFKRTYKKDVTVSFLKVVVPETAAVGEAFTCRIENFDKLKRKYPNLRIEWTAESIPTNNFTQVSFNNNTGEAIFRGNENGMVSAYPNIVLNGSSYSIGIGDGMVNIGTEFLFTYNSVDGTCVVYLGNLPSEPRYERIEWIKINEIYDTYTLNGTFDITWGYLPCQIAGFTETSPTNKAKVKARIYYKNGQTKELISPILPFREIQTKAASSIEIQPLEQQTILAKPTVDNAYTIEIYTLPQGNRVYSKKNVIDFDINSLLIPKGMYIVRMTDQNGNVTSGKVLKK